MIVIYVSYWLGLLISRSLYHRAARRKKFRHRSLRKDHQPLQTLETLHQCPILCHIEDFGLLQSGESMPIWLIGIMFCTFVRQQAFLGAISGHLGHFFDKPGQMSYPDHVKFTPYTQKKD